MKAKMFVIFVLAAVVVGCHSVRRGEPLTGTVPLRDESTRRGQVLFMQHCNQCHPFGGGGLGPALNDKPAPGFLVKTQVRVGLGAMPGFSREQISPEELNHLVDYVMALRKVDREH